MSQLASPTSGTPLPTTNPLATWADSTVVAVVNVEITVAENALIAAQPWLGWPVIKQIWEMAFEYFIKQLGQALGKLTGYVVIDAQKYFALKKAVSAQIDLNSAKASGDSDAVKKASAAVDAAVAPILHYVGSA